MTGKLIAETAAMKMDVLTGSQGIRNSNDKMSNGKRLNKMRSNVQYKKDSCRNVCLLILDFGYFVKPVR